MEALLHLADTFLDTIFDVLPIIAILLGFQLFVLRRTIPNLKKVLIGFVCVLLGLSFFLQGLEMALFPLGKLMAQQLTDPAFITDLTDLADLGGTVDAVKRAAVELGWWDYRWVYASARKGSVFWLLVFAFALGFGTTVAEPALIAVVPKPKAKAKTNSQNTDPLRAKA